MRSRGTRVKTRAPLNLSLCFLKSMSDVLLAKVARRALDESTRVDMSGTLIPKLASTLNTADAEASETALGFSVPVLLKSLYEKVGNGGFGPGYGLIGLKGGAPDDQGKDAIELHELYSSRDPEDSSWAWPEGLLPICHWGCAIYSCVDCKDADYSIVTFDPNLHDQSWAQCFIRTNRNLESWLDAWAGGTKLWDEMYGAQQET
jgi:hypothetical protein